MAKRPRKPRAASTPHPTQAKVLDLLANAPPAAVAQREQSWTVEAADSLLKEFPGPPRKHAAELREKSETFDGGIQAALAIADEMDRRDRMGVRFWPGSAVAREAAAAKPPDDIKRSGEGQQPRSADHDNIDPPAPEDL